MNIEKGNDSRRKSGTYSIGSLFFAGIALLTIVATIVVGYVALQQEYARFQKEADRIRTQYVQNQKQMIRNETEKVYDFINYSLNSTEERLRADIKEQTEKACAIATELHNKYKGRVNDAMLIEIIKDALRAIRFNNGRGYYFATGMDGVEILFADRPELEGKQLIDMQDTEGKFVIRDMIDIVRKNGEGYYSYKWTKPGSKEKNFPKIAYLKYFEPFNGFIGTGEYIDDVEQDIQKEVLQRIGKIRFGDNGYIFVVSYDGVTLMNGVQPELIGQAMWEMTDPYGVKVIQEERRVAEIPGGDYIYYHWKKPSSGTISPKTSFVKGFPQWRWMFGAGVYLDEVETVISSMEEGVKADRLKSVVVLALFLVALMAVLLMSSYFFSRRLKREFDVFVSFFKSMEKGGEPIDIETLSIRELAALGESANVMLAKRREAEVELKKFKVIADNANYGMVITTTDRKLVYFNEYFARSHGYSIEEMTGFDIDMLHNPEQRARVDRILGTLFERGSFVMQEVLHRHRDGHDFPMLMNGTLIHIDDNTPPLIAATAIDISTQKQVEMEKAQLENQLLQSQKMEAVGRLAGGIAHDFNNLLTSISGNAELALMDVEVGSPLSASLYEIQKAATSAAGLIRQLLAFSRKQIIEPKVVRINDLIFNLQKMLIRIIGENIQLDTILGEDVEAIRIDPIQFEQILVNLVVNARDAMPDGGTLDVETRKVFLDEDFCHTHAEIQPGSYVMLSVSDSGCGMSEEVLSHIFEPFFTTKPKGTGTGLGLPTIYGAVRQAGGVIDVESSEGHGSRFKVYLPSVSDKVEIPEGESSDGVLAGGSETVLLVEDEQMVRKLVVKLLDRMGYKVIQASNGQEALEMASSCNMHIDLLMTDIIMPGINGKELSEKLKNSLPDMKVLFTSGYTENVIAQEGILEEGLNFIGKPYTPQKLAAILRRIFEG